MLHVLSRSVHPVETQSGTINVSGESGEGAKDAAFEMGAAPITLINCETLIDLLIQRQIGVKKKTVEYYELDDSAFQAQGPEEAEGLVGEANGEDLG